jgi:asparagine synthase (glutamine-hydrolysing)
MCGIIGSINHSLSRECLKYIKHRGPDSEGWYSDGPFNLGHVRLSVQDLSSNANQPFVSKSGNLIIAYNGEIYNHWELRKSLENKGVVFRTTSDTETIIEGIEKEGLSFISKLNGIFAFGLLDISKCELVICRDRFGIKPLYYSLTDDYFIFCSELKAIPVLNQNINIKALSNYIRLLWSPGDETPLEEVKKVLPGGIIKISFKKDKLECERSFIQAPTFNGSRLLKSEEELISDLENLILQAIDRQLLSDVPIGFFLSGGLDSSLLVAMARKLRPNEKIQCFTVDTTFFSNSEGFSNDLDYAIQVAKFLNVDLEVVNSEINIDQEFDKVIWYLDEPQADPAPLNVYNISKRAREMGFKVLIGGVGGDDLFSGYRRHKLIRLEKTVRYLPQIIHSIIGLLAFFNPTSPTKRRLLKFLKTFTNKRNNRLFTYFEWLEYDEVLNLFSNTNKQKLLAVDPHEFFKDKLKEISKEKSILNQMLYLEQKSFLVDHNFNYTDKMGMAAGVEIRVPFLDNDLVDFSYQLPVRYKLNSGETKYLLKKVAEKYLPKEVVYRSKSGFGAPVREWILRDLQPMIDQRLSLESLGKRDIFNSNKILELINANKKGKVDASYSIWALLAIESWLIQFHDSKSV